MEPLNTNRQNPIHMQHLIVSAVQNPAFTFDDGSCVYDDPTGGSCLMDGDGDGTIGVGDLLTLLTMFGTTCQL